ncbi:MAG: hypothetical protein QJR13_05570 [Bacillota bacterium]|nr:hypothetical protein [Bacillota bacterium]
MAVKEWEEAGWTDSEREEACRALAALIREQSQAGRLCHPEELRAYLAEKGFTGLGAGEEEERAKLLEEVRQRQEDIRSLPGPDGELRYYSLQYMSESYARLLVRREGDPLLLIAETVRESSALYPRPVPASFFTGPPFELTEEELHACLESMASREEYGDIARTTSSAGTVFLYSTRHLDHGYASFLAEWLDVGQAANP